MRAPEFWSRDDAAARLAAAALSPLGWFYGAVTDWKRTHAHPYRSRAKVVCVGNLTTGGSGKTPVVQELARLLTARGLKTVILSRGYGGRAQDAVMVNRAVHSAADVGDEPLLLARTAPVIVARNRPQGAKLADRERTDVIVMDDGYQNFTLAKDFALVVVDAESAFGNGRVLPAGPLRESVRDGLARADAVVLVGDGSPPLPGYSGPVLRARLVPREVETLKGRKVVAFAGIGRPEKFFATLRTADAELAATISFADHHMFTTDDIAQLKQKARNEKAMLVTTEKDFVRLAPSERSGILALTVEAQFDRPEVLKALFDNSLTAGVPSR